MNCHNAREEAIGSPELSPAARQHVKDCEDCRAFCAELRAIQTALETPVETPSFLRARTLARCRELLREKTAVGEMSLWQRCRRAFDSPRFVAAAALLGAAVLITATALQIDDAQDEATNLFLKLTIFQVAAQNVFTALFLPALLLFKSGLAGIPSRAMKTGE